MPNFFAQFDPASPPEDDEVASYIIEASRKRGIPEQDALDVWAGEGKGAWQSNFVKNGKRERSYGPFQLYVDGGLGNAFQRDTGLDPSDPSTWRQGVDYALDTAQREGWGQWYGAPPHLRSRGGYKPMRMGPSDNFFAKFDTHAAPETPSEPTAEPPAREAPQPVGPSLTNSELADDVGRSGISGISEGLIGLAGLPGELAEILKDVPVDTGGIGDWLRENARVEDIAAIETPYGKIGDLTGYESKTPLGSAVGTVGRSAPVAMGAASLPRAAAIAGGTGLATEIGQEAAGDLGGAGAGVAAATLLSRGRVPPRAPMPRAADYAAAEANMVTTPGTEAVRRISQQAYQRANQMGIQIGGQPFNNFRQTLVNDPVLRPLILNPQLHPRLSHLLDDISGGPMAGMTGGRNTHITLEEFDNIRRNVLRSTRSAEPNERRLAGHMIDRLDDFFDHHTPRGATQVMNQARNNWRIFRKSERIDQIMEVARDRAGQFSVSGNENALRTGFRQLSTEINRNPRTRNLFTRDEINTIRRLSRGWNVRNALRGVGAILNNRFVSGGAAGLGGYDYLQSGDTGGLILAAAMKGGGMAARGVSGRMASGEANNLSRLVRGGGHYRGHPNVAPAAAALLAINPYSGQ